VICPLCGKRSARRACPALAKQICAVCCGTKRLVEIQCPADCSYLASAREHPAAPVLRQQQRDLGLLLPFVRDLSERQSQLFFLAMRFLLQYEPPELQRLIDDDVVGAVTALAATLETSARGVIYEHRPTSLPAERLANAIKPLLAEVGERGGSAFDRDAAVVLRRIEAAASGARTGDEANPRAFLDLVARVLRKTAEEAGGDEPAASAEGQRLILP
jgi:hypothetical protein